MKSDCTLKSVESHAMSWAMHGADARLRSASITRRCLCLQRLSKRVGDTRVYGSARPRSASDGRRCLCLRRQLSRRAADARACRGHCNVSSHELHMCTWR